MIVYEHKAVITVSGGNAASTTLENVGGRLKYLLIRALTSGTTTFQANLQDKNLVTRLNYDFHEGEIMDNTIDLPLVGPYTVNVTNASATDTFQVILSVLEK